MDVTAETGEFTRPDDDELPEDLEDRDASRIQIELDPGGSEAAPREGPDPFIGAAFDVQSIASAQEATSSSDVLYPDSLELNPELVVCELVPVEGSKELKLEERTNSAESTDERALTWIIGTNNPSHSAQLDKLSRGLLNSSFSEVCGATDKGLRKASWFGEVLHAHVPRFEIDPENPLRVKRQVVELLVGSKAVVAIDHSGQNDTLLDLRQAVINRLVPTFQIASAGALSNRLIEHVLGENFKVLDQLDEKLMGWEKAVKKGALPDDVISELSELKETLLFFKRKSEQTSEVLLALRQASTELPGLFNERNAGNILHGGEQSLRSLLGRTSDMIERIDSVGDVHDRARKARSDSLIENFTILIGVSAPPIIVDLLCKNCLEAVPEWHPWLVAGSVVAAIGMAAYAKMTDWSFKL